MTQKFASAIAVNMSGAMNHPGSGQDQNLRQDLAVIADWIKPKSRVLDLGCGDGALLAYLARHKQCTGYGVEIDDNQVLASAKRGVNVIQRNIEQGLSMFGQGQFDVAVLSMSLQVTKETEKVLREMSSVASNCIVSFPNFGHWFHIWSIFKGRMPVSTEMPYQWYNTPNLHLATTHDFEDFLGQLNLSIVQRTFLKDGKPVSFMPVKRATQAIYQFKKPL
jgi:methionine biosynthesis protein MetW